MARLSAQARAAQAAEHLQKSAEEQQEIGLQALKAIENGIDPEIALSVADAALKESVPQHQREEDRVPESNPYLKINPIFSPENGSVKLKYVLSSVEPNVDGVDTHVDDEKKVVVLVGISKGISYVNEKYVDILLKTGLYERID